MEKELVVARWLDWIRDLNVFPPRYQELSPRKRRGSGYDILNAYKRKMLPEKDERFSTPLFLNLLLENEDRCKESLTQFYTKFWPRYTYDGVNFNSYELEKIPSFSEWLFDEENRLIEIYFQTFPEIEMRIRDLNRLREGEFLKPYLFLYIQMAHAFYFY